jgi:fumarylacetoacetate (FAA) hydrolase
MDFGFGELLSYLAYNRRLGAGMVLGSGTVSNRGYRTVGSACLAEQRAVEVMDYGAPRTAFLAYGERLRMDAKDAAGQSVFGAIESRFVAAASAD